MFHECKVYDAKGKLKTTYTKEQVSSAHWHNTIENNNQITFSETGNVVPGIVKGTRRTLICEYSECQKEFTTTHRKTKVCSDICGRQIKRQKDIKRRRAVSKNQDFIAPQEYENGFYGYKIDCQECNVTSYKKNYKARFCSPICATRYKNKCTARKKKYYEIICKFCDESAKMKSSHARYCSDKCRERATKQRNKATTTG